jgi:hypothetical protein
MDALIIVACPGMDRRDCSPLTVSLVPATRTELLGHPRSAAGNAYPFQIDLLVTALSASLVRMKDRGVIADQISMPLPTLDGDEAPLRRRSHRVAVTTPTDQCRPGTGREYHPRRSGIYPTGYPGRRVEAVRRTHRATA